MPLPENYNNKDDFISDCISENIKEGKTKDEAAGKCYGIWDNAKKSQFKKDLNDILKLLRGK
jgi:hypothetical protein